MIARDAVTEVRSRRPLTASVMRAMTLLSGTRVLILLCSVVRVKLVALWIGATGVGLFGIYNSFIELMSALTQLNVRDSSVRDIAGVDDISMRHRIIGVVRRWAAVLGLFGSLLTLALSPLLSRVTFGDDAHACGFVWLSAVMLFSSVTGGELAILQGSRLLGRLAAASLAGAVGGLLLSVPLFYFLGIDSIVPSIGVYALSTLVAALLLRYKGAGTASGGVTLRETVAKGCGFLRLGAWMTVAAFVTLLSQYIFIVYVNNRGGVDDVGFYQAGFTLVNKYIGLLLVGVAMEYYPRLASRAGSLRSLGVYANHEIVTLSWIAMPCVSLFIVFRGLIVEMLYSAEFESILPYVTWAMAGTVLRCVSWCMGYVMLARGDGKAYVVCESVSAVVYLVLNTLFYEMWEVESLGKAYFLWYAVYCVTVMTVCRVRYGLRLRYAAMSVVTVSLLVVMLTMYLTDLSLLLGLAAALTGCVVSIVALRRMTA